MSTVHRAVLAGFFLSLLATPGCFIGCEEVEEECEGPDDYCACKNLYVDCAAAGDHPRENPGDYCWELRDPTEYDRECYDAAVTWFFHCADVSECGLYSLNSCESRLSDRLWDCSHPMQDKSAPADESLNDDFDDDVDEFAEVE